VYTKELPKSSNDINSLNVLIDRSLQNFPEYLASEGLFEYGVPTAASSAEPKMEDAEIATAEFISMDWKDRLSISREAPADWHSSDGSAARQYGNLVHMILSEILVKDDLQIVLREYNSKGLITEAEMPVLSETLHKLLDHQEIAVFFEEGLKVKMEEDLLTPSGDSYRPDRVVYRDSLI